MVKKGIPKTTINRIRTLSRQNKSANQIQRILKREHRGIRRQTLLAYVRKFKGVKPKPQRYKYIPRKYRRRPAIAKPKRPRPEKHVAVYGRHRGKSKRIEMSGTGKGLYRFLIDAVIHPPKKRFERMHVKGYMGFSTKAKYLDYGEEWDEKPTVKS